MVSIGAPHVGRRTAYIPAAGAGVLSAVALVNAYRLAFAALLAVGSIQTLMHEPDAVVLAGVELAAIPLFWWRRTELLGAGLLIVVFALAEALSIVRGQWPTHILQYAATAVFIVLLDRKLRPAV